MLSNLNKSFFDEIGQKYSNRLSVEIAELQREIYLPLLPLEKMSIKVLQAYEDLGRSYWFKDDVYTAMEGNFYIPMLFPMVENTAESTELIHKEPKTRNVSSTDGYGTEQYVTRTFVILEIPRHIVMQFSNVIPKGTKFCIGFVGGSTNISEIKILSVAETIKKDETNLSVFDQVIDMTGLTQEQITEKVREDLALIDEETARRNKIEEDYYNARQDIISGRKQTRRRSQ